MDKKAENELLDAVLARARKLGLAIELETIGANQGDRQIDVIVRIGTGRLARTYAAEIKRGIRPATLGATLHQMERLGRPGLLIADHVTPPMAETLRARGIAFLDAAGNAHIDQPPILVWVKCERPPNRELPGHDVGRAFRPGGLKVVFALLCHPGWADLPYRELAKRAGVAHGTVGGVVADLQKLRYLAEIDGARRLLQPERLLRQWAEAYARTLRPKLLLGRYRTDLPRWWMDLAPQDYAALLGGEVAAEKLTQHLRPEIITLYAAKPEPRLLLDYRLRADNDGPVELVKRFWEFDTTGEALVPLPLIYADLLVTGDARCIETADLIYERILNGFIE
jgi:hypothetical protein